MLISPKYCKVKSYVDDEDDDEDVVGEDDEDDDHDNLHYSHYNIDSKDDEYLGIHVVGQRLRLGTPSTPSSSKSVNQATNQSLKCISRFDKCIIHHYNSQYLAFSIISQSISLILCF